MRVDKNPRKKVSGNDTYRVPARKFRESICEKKIDKLIFFIFNLLEVNPQCLKNIFVVIFAKFTISEILFQLKCHINAEIFRFFAGLNVFAGSSRD